VQKNGNCSKKKKKNSKNLKRVTFFQSFNFFFTAEGEGYSIRFSLRYFYNNSLGVYIFCCISGNALTPGQYMLDLNVLPENSYHKLASERNKQLSQEINRELLEASSKKNDNNNNISSALEFRTPESKGSLKRILNTDAAAQKRLSLRLDAAFKAVVKTNYY
jgi:hypothetical protein